MINDLNERLAYKARLKAGFFKRESFSCTPKKNLLENKNLLLAVLDELRVYVVPNTFYYTGSIQSEDEHFMSLVVSLYRTQKIENLDKDSIQKIIEDIFYCNREFYRQKEELNTFLIFLSEPQDEKEKNMLQSLEKNTTLEKKLMSLEVCESETAKQDDRKYYRSSDCAIM